jgi:hypothetical protein
MTFRLATISALFLFAASAAFAEPFVAASAGRTQWNTDCAGLPSCDTHGAVATFRAGYQFTPYVGVEARYANLGRLAADFPSSVALPEGTVTFGRQEFHSHAAGIDVILTSPVWAGWSVGAMGGVAHANGRRRTSIPAVGSDEVSASATRGYYGVRASYAVWTNIDASLEADRYRVSFPGGGSTSADTLAIGLTYRFR